MRRARVLLALYGGSIRAGAVILLVVLVLSVLVFARVQHAELVKANHPECDPAYTGFPNRYSPGVRCVDPPVGRQPVP